MNTLSLYIHIPFCIKKCAYCDFLSAPQFDAAGAYFAALKKEINAFETDKEIYSIFFGGGTPSAVDERYVADILDLIAKKYSIARGCEISLESNPGTLTENKLRTYKNSGMNRISMGAQSFDDRLLKILGRIHGKNGIIKSFELVKKHFDNHNLDLMFALPSQSLKDWQDTLENAIKLEPTHISAYSLIIEEGTPFYDKYEPADEKLDRGMYYAARDFLAENGYRQYEISNFAKKGFECRHNLVYWQGGDYKGFGLGAASLINGSRLKNTEDMQRYLDGKTIAETIVLSRFEQMQEFVMLGLRCTDGISAEKFKNTFETDIYTAFGDIIKKHEKSGLLEISGDNIRLTKKGIDLSNMVFVDLV